MNIVIVVVCMVWCGVDGMAWMVVALETKQMDFNQSTNKANIY